LKRFIPYFAAAAFFFAVVSGIGNFSLINQLGIAQRDIDALAETAQNAADSATVDSANAARALERAARDSVRAETAESLLAIVRASRAPARAATEAAILASPDTCDLVIEALQDELAIADAVARGEATKYAAERQSHNTTKSDLAAAQRGLAQAAIRLAALADDAGEIDVRPGFFGRILPKTGIGAFAGVSSEGKPVVGLGVTLGWRISL
jgi:hypothetical protein